MQQQIPLGFKFNNEVTFETFVPGDSAQAVLAIQKLGHEKDEHYIYIWGGKGAGKTHLLQALCQQYSEHQRPVAYLALEDSDHYPPSMLDGLENLSLVCIDDIEYVTGNAEWEEALFHFFNRMRDHKTPLLISGSKPPAQLNLQLPDIKSRIGWGLILQIKLLNDADKLQALQKRASFRGMELSDESGLFLLSRYSRDLNDLFNLLDKLDKASLCEQRRLTIPFIRQHL